MKLSEVLDILAAKVLWGEDLLDKEVNVGFGCDLMSDSLAYAKPGCLLITGLTNVHIIKIAEMIEANAILFVRGKMPAMDVIEYAAKRKIPLMMTDRFLFESCGILYNRGLKEK